MTAANPITPAVLAHLPVLEFLDTNGPSTAAQITAATERVYSNVKRDMPKLVTASLLSQYGSDAATAVFTLTIDGKSALAAMARARGEETGGVPTALASELTRNPKQPRQKFDEEALERLADTIQEKGILQPLVVRPVGADGLRAISAGERRWRAAQIVNERLGDPAAVRLPYIERDATPEEQAEEEAYAAYIAVVENGQREPLTTYEEALAYRAMIPALYPSARACGKATGVDGKTVSDRLKALEVLTEAQQAEWRAGNLTWREVRDIFRPPAQAEADPNQMDIEEVTGPGGLTAAEILALVEIEHRRATGKSTWNGWTTLSGPIPNNMRARLVLGSGGKHLSDLQDHDGGKVTHRARLTTVGEHFLATKGIWPEGAPPNDVLNRARSQRSAWIPRPLSPGEYATPWVSVPSKAAPTDDPAAAEEIAPIQAPSASEAADTSKAVNLTDRQRLVLIEATHKMVVENTLTAGRAARVGSYWLDAACSALVDAQLLRFVNAGGEAGWHVMWGEKAYAWFRANLPEAFSAKGDLEVSELLLHDARAQAGESLRPIGFTTPWLNVASMALPTETQALPAPAENETEGDESDQEAHDILERVTDELYHGSTFAELLALTGIKLPLRLAGGFEIGVILDADDSEVLTVDGAGELPDALVAARALLIATAIEDAADHVDMTPDFKPSKPGDRAAMRRSITPWAITCLEDGRRFRGGLKRHLRTVYNLSWAEYLAKWELPNDYPSLAPTLAEARDVMARNVAAASVGGGR